jgi:hypothetical protein
MKHIFRAKIYQTGINWCVDVPTKITKLLTSEKGRITIKGQINGFDFTKTLIPVRNAPHRLFVNQRMMKGGGTALGKTAAFQIEQDSKKANKEYAIPALLVELLHKHKLISDFENLTVSKRREILKYLSYIKTEETLLKNISKLVVKLKNKERDIRIP